jgi:hypothetical protein
VNTSLYVESKCSYQYNPSLTNTTGVILKTDSKASALLTYTRNSGNRDVSTFTPHADTDTDTLVMPFPPGNAGKLVIRRRSGMFGGARAGYGDADAPSPSVATVAGYATLS